ncbi:MAG: glycoside hydrolase family 65 protein [Anaerolineales bacterium]|nr:glycoside hydrolase family 65 protein [Anaerolineales bacterium]
MSWIITETRQLDEKASDRLGNKFLVGNGYIGYRGTLEEHAKERKTATIAAGLYDQAGEGLWREPVNLPNGGFLELVYQGRPLRAHAGPVEEHSQSLDLRHAVHERMTVFTAEDGNRITLRAKRFVSATRRHLFCAQYVVETSRDCELIIHTGIDGDVWDLNGPHLRDFITAVDDPLISISARTGEKGIPVSVCEYFVCPGRNHVFLTEERRILREFLLQTRAGQPYTLVKFAAIHTGVDTPDPPAAGRSLCWEAIRTGFDALLKDHRQYWEARWTDCDLQILGDSRAQLALRFSLYHLLAIAPVETDTVSIPARGLSGQVYKGGIFWDTEIFMLPFFAHEFPEIARNLLMYRFRTLEGARRKAREYGYRGAFYAWESQDTGDDACTLYNITDIHTGRPMRTYFRDKQIHISADIPYAIGEYFSITGDDSLLLEGGAEVVYECARFFLSYLHYSPDRKQYEFLDVTGPDEYHERVHNNAYTNWMAAHTFALCLRVAAHLQKHHPAPAKALLQKLGFRKDLEAIRKTVRKIYQPAADPRTSVIPQFDGYLQLEDPPLAELLRLRSDPREYLGGGNGLASNTQILKQADVILALCLFPERFARETVSANWEYYEPRTEQGSSLSACSYSIAAAGIGKLAEAYEFFMTAASLDLDGDPKQYVGPLYIGGTHPAASGGAWMAAVSGLCGIRWSGKLLTIDPRLPAPWSEVRLPLLIRGDRLQIVITRKDVTLRPMQPLQHKVRVRIRRKVRTLPRQGTLTVEYGAPEWRS